ncbi:copper chaperone PCu(A)C [Paracoccus sp. (in: a-proteobacteria)]|uniref:copper chaperone PCu(A)C n=1 Tax=Paracoccus sp. TaxID=267 RepID=UPI0026DF0F09|nr:copper chaperone PCu(A)C [Paracoccus sp. (in: a-proteobacteria)]MDO5647190.1 copper chaperone PCu(A)C [Paracoccus sp. (in: a-proteobacteria)]
MKKLTFAAVAALMPVVAMAHDGVHIHDGYARSSNPTVGAAFFMIENHRDVDCTLIGAESPLAPRTELHTHREVDGLMKMVHVPEGFVIPANGEHELARGGDHIMLFGLEKPLADGDVVPLSLDFGDCGVETVEFTVDNHRKAAHSH